MGIEGKLLLLKEFPICLIPDSPLLAYLQTQGSKVTPPPPLVIILLSVPRRLFCFGSLVVLDVVCNYVLLFVLDIKNENR